MLKTALVGTAIVAGCFIGGCDKGTSSSSSPAGAAQDAAQQGANDAASNNDQAKIGELFTKIDQEVKDQKNDDAKSDLKTLEGMKDKLSAEQQTKLQTLETTVNGSNPAGAMGNAAQQGAADAGANNDQAKIGVLFAKIKQEVTDLKVSDAQTDLKALEAMKDKMSPKQVSDLQTLETTVNGHVPATNPAMPAMPGMH